ncbi:uncharacterized protein TNCV_490731 [Trichonephila clavipes]|nr:uncharacterized protein TNCV_490731 [Trichonephila clavipes]
MKVAILIGMRTECSKWVRVCPKSTCDSLGEMDTLIVEEGRDVSPTSLTPLQGDISPPRNSGKRSQITAMVSAKIYIGDHFAEVATINGVQVSFLSPRSYVIKTLQNKLIEDWESWWSNSNTGLRDKFFFPKSSFDINLHSSYVTQFLTKHAPFVSFLHRLKLKTTPNCLYGSVGVAAYYVFSCPLTKDFHWVSPSQNTKKAGLQSIVRNSSIHFKLKSCIKIVSTIRDQIS